MPRLALVALAVAGASGVGTSHRLSPLSAGAPSPLRQPDSSDVELLNDWMQLAASGYEPSVPTEQRIPQPDVVPSTRTSGRRVYVDAGLPESGLSSAYSSRDAHESRLYAPPRKSLDANESRLPTLQTPLFNVNDTLMHEGVMHETPLFNVNDTLLHEGVMQVAATDSGATPTAADGAHVAALAAESSFDNAAESALAKLKQVLARPRKNVSRATTLETPSFKATSINAAAETKSDTVAADSVLDDMMDFVSSVQEVSDAPADGKKQEEQAKSGSFESGQIDTREPQPIAREPLDSQGEQHDGNSLWSDAKALSGDDATEEKQEQKGKGGKLERATAAAHEKSDDFLAAGVLNDVLDFVSSVRASSDEPCTGMMSSFNKQETCDARQERCGDAYLAQEEQKCCSVSAEDGGLACPVSEPPETQCSSSIRGSIIAVNQSMTSSCGMAHNIDIGFKRRPYADPPQVPLVLTATYPAYIELTDVHKKESRWCDCEHEAGDMGLPLSEQQALAMEEGEGTLPPQTPSVEALDEDDEAYLTPTKMANLMDRRQVLLSQSRDSEFGRYRENLNTAQPAQSQQQQQQTMSQEASFLEIADMSSTMSAAFKPTLNLVADDNKFIDSNGWPFSMHTPQAASNASLDGTACRFAVQTIYHSGKMEFIAFCDYSWRYPLMEVVGPHGRRVHASWIEIRRSSGCGTMTGIFVLAQTGYLKLLPLVPDKLLRNDWVPFGTSDILLGPSRGLALDRSVEPVSSISQMRIDADGKINLLYADQVAQPSIVQLTLVTDRSQAQLTVQGLAWQSHLITYLRYRSMHVKLGVSDVDTITGSDGVALPVMYASAVPGVFQRQWEKVSGPSWSMQRQCVSVTNTLSPDISVQLDCTESGNDELGVVGGFGKSFRRRDASKLFVYDESPLPLPLELTEARASWLFALGLAVGIFGSSEYCLAAIAIGWSTGFQLGVVWNPTASITSAIHVAWFNTADPTMGVSDTRILVPQSPLGDGVLVAFDIAIAVFMSLQIRDFFMGAVFAYQALKVVIGLFVCGYAVQIGAEPDLELLRSFGMRAFFALCSATLGVIAIHRERVRDWITFGVSSLQGATWFVTSMCWFKPWLPPVAQIAPLWDNDWRTLPPGMRARLGAGFYAGVFATMIVLLCLQLAVRYPTATHRKLRRLCRLLTGKRSHRPEAPIEYDQHIENTDKWQSHVYKVIVIIGMCISSNLVIMQFDWERGNWVFMIAFIFISAFLSWNIVDLSVSTLCFYAYQLVLGFKPLATKNLSHGIPDDCRTAIAYCLLSGSEESSIETWETATAGYLGNLCPNGNLKAAVVSVSNNYRVVMCELDSRDRSREVVERVLREAYAEVAPVVRAEITAQAYAGNLEAPMLAPQGTAKYMWSVLLRGPWRSRRSEWDELMEAKIKETKEGLLYLHRSCRVLKKPGQYQDMMLLMARGVTGAMSYLSDYYGSYGRPRNSANWGFHSNLNWTTAPEGANREELRNAMEARMAPDIELLRANGASGLEKPKEPGGLCRYRYCMMMDKDTVLPAGAAWQLIEVGAANKWVPGMPARPGVGPGIISCQLQVERVPDTTWFMWANMVIEATKPSVDRCWYELTGASGFFGKGLLDCEKYIQLVIGRPDKLIEALPVDIMSHDTPEGFLLRPCFCDHVIMEEEPARNFITFESQTTRWMVGELLNLCYEHEVLLRRPVNATRRFVGWLKGKKYEVPRLRPMVSTSSWAGRYMASKALREYHSGPLMLCFLVMVTFQHNVPGYLTPISFENYTPDNVLPIMYPGFQLTMLIIFIVSVFVLPKVSFMCIGLHPRLFRRHGCRRVIKLMLYRVVYSIVDLVVCACAFSSEVPCAWLRYLRAWTTLFSGINAWKPQDQAEREIEEAKANPRVFAGVLVSKTWHVQLTGWTFLVLLASMWTECTTLWVDRVPFLTVVSALTWGRWVLFPMVVWCGCGTLRPGLYRHCIQPLGDMLLDNGRVFDAQGIYDKHGEPVQQPPPEPEPPETKVQVDDPTDEAGNAWPGVWSEFQQLTPYLQKVAQDREQAEERRLRLYRYS